ncbi:MAG: archease [Anaerolineales bacterium]|nr:archease [Anaerolineales bacterium]
MGFEEIPHTADLALRIWADDLPGLFVEAARGLNVLSGVHLSDKPIQCQTLDIESEDSESLLVAFLTELVYLTEQENMAFDKFDLSIKNNHLHAELHGSSLVSLTKNIKAVTFHNLQIQRIPSGLQVEIVFDV